MAIFAFDPSEQDDAIITAGAIVWRIKPLENELQVLLVHRPKVNDWSFPKGRRTKGENIAKCAIREVAEETGRRIILGRFLDIVNKTTVSNKSRRIYYWSARVSNDSDYPALLTRLTIKLSGPEEIDKIKWVNLEQAKKMISNPVDLGPLAKLEKYAKKETLDTSAIAITKGLELENSSRKIIPLFSAFGIIKAFCEKEKLKCVESILPFTNQARLKIEDLNSLITKNNYRLTKWFEAGNKKSFAVCASGKKISFFISQISSFFSRKLNEEFFNFSEKSKCLKTNEVLIIHTQKNSKKIVSLEFHKLFPTHSHNKTN